MKLKRLIFWNSHKYFKNKKLLVVIRAIQKWYFCRHGKLIKRYTWNVETQGAKSTKEYIIDNRTLITGLYSRRLVREFIINYRSRFDVSKPNKLYNDFMKHIASKSLHHSSDIAIACNIVKNVRLTDEQQHALLDFVILRLSKRLPNLSKLGDIKLLNIKKVLVLDKVNQLKILKQ